MQPLISIIIPVYNHADALERALASIAAQSYENLEIIIVDDGSAEAVRLQTPDFGLSIQVVRQENKGAPVARNAGFALSKGEYVIFWDADVVGEPEMLEKMLGSLEENVEASFAYSNHYFGRKRIPSRQFNNSTIQQNNYIHSTSLIRRSSVVKWDEQLKRFQDWDMWLTMAEAGKIGVWIDEYLFRVDTGGTMSTWLPRMAYKNPWRWLPGISSKVRKYEETKKIVQKKHGLR